MRRTMGGQMAHRDRRGSTTPPRSTPCPVLAGRRLASLSDPGETDCDEDRGDTSGGRDDA